MYRTLLVALVGALLAVPGNVLAQETGTVTGTVVDSTTSEPLPGVNTIIEGENIGAATDQDGQFEISNVPAGEQVLVVSFVGYQTKRRPIEVQANSTINLRIRLASQAVGLEDVIVTALGVEREERAVATSVQQIGGADLAQTDNENFINALKGKVAGASIKSSNTMGGSSNIVLRGYSSISGSNQPLIVVDGIVINNRRGTDSGFQNQGYGGFDYGNAASSINPNNIESMSVLKGPSAAALYGSRGANGVIQITTKDGTRGQDELGVTFSSEVTATQAYHFMNYQNQYGAGSSSAFQTLDGDFHIDGSLENDPYIPQYAVDESWGPALDGRPARHWYSWDDVNGLEGQSTPWVPQPGAVEDFLETGLTYNNNLAFSNSGEDFNYRLSLSSRNTDGVMPNSHLNRYQFQFNGSADLSDDLTATAVTRYSYREAQGRVGTGYGFEENPFAAFNTFTQRQLDYGPDSYMRDYVRPDGQQRGWNYLGVQGAQSPTNFNFTDNPYVSRYENFQTDDRQRIFGKAEVAYDFTEDFSSSWNITTDFYTERRGDRLAELSTEDPPGFSQGLLEVQETASELRFNYETDLTENFDLSSFAATKVRYETFDDNSAETQNGLSAPGVFTVENSVGRPSVTDYFEEKLVYSVYGSVNLGYNRLAYLEATLRNDWSSTLPADNNSYTYPSVSGNFIFTQLEALQDQDIISFGKIRASWAQVGNDTSPYQLGTTFPVNVPFEGQPLQQVQRSSNNPNLKPEITTGIEFGGDLEFFDNRASLNATWYRDVTRNQILSIDVSRASGFNSALVNAGEISNRGLEASLTVTPVLTEEFQWDVTTNFNKNVNKVVELAEGIETFTIADFTIFGPDIQAKVGETYGAMVGRALLRDQDGDMVFTRSGVPRTTSDPKTLGTFMPDWTGGISTTFSYKGLTVSALVDGQMGGNVYSVSNLFGPYSGLTKASTAGNQREVGVIPDGVVLPAGTSPSEASEVDGIPFEEAVGRIPAATYWKNWFSGRLEAYMYDATHAKLQEVAITYTLPQRWFANTPLRRANIGLTGNNLMFLYREAPNIDPSVTLGAGNIQGIEAGQIPTQRTFGFRVNLTF